MDSSDVVGDLEILEDTGISSIFREMALGKTGNTERQSATDNPRKESHNQKLYLRSSSLEPRSNKRILLTD